MPINNTINAKAKYNTADIIAVIKLSKVEPTAKTVFNIGVIKSPVTDINENPRENSLKAGDLYSGSHIFNNVIPVINTPVKVPQDTIALSKE